MTLKKKFGSGRVRILIATRIFFPEVAAASFRLRAVSRALSRARVEVEVFTTTVPEQSAVSNDDGVKVSRWPALRDKAGRLIGYVPYMSFDLPLFFRLLMAKRPDIALIEPPPTTGVMARLALGIRRIPYVWYAPDVWSDATEALSVPGIVKRAVRAMESFAIRGAARCLAINDGVADRVRALGGKDVVVIPNGIDTDIFAPEGGERPEFVTEVVGHSPYLLYAGTASQWQGADIFISAFNEVCHSCPDLRLVFLGQGAAWEELENAARQSAARDRIHFCPAVEPEVAAEWLGYAEASLASVMPGIGYDFAYPTKIFASLSTGTPVVLAGPSPAVADIESADLGYACLYEKDAVVAVFRSIAQDVAAVNERSRRAEGKRRRAWVVSNRSIEETGRQAARAVLNVLGVDPVFQED